MPLTDHFALSRSVKRTIGAGFSGTYYKGSHLGITAEAFLLGLGYDDTCRLVGSGPVGGQRRAVQLDR